MKKSNYSDLKKIAEHFTFDGVFVEAKEYGFGHINDTYAVYMKLQDSTTHRYLLQRINTNIFKNPEALMKNIASVTRFLREKILQTGGNPERETLNLVPTINGSDFYISPEGDYWRSYLFIEGALGYQTVVDLQHFYNAGKAFGRFQLLLNDFPAASLYETIPDFHNTGKRLVALRESVKTNLCGRAADVEVEIEFVERRADECGIIGDMLRSGYLPLRVTHNDTKFNNVLIDNMTGEGICVVDLDTVMPGSSLYDFGDSIRSGANPADEDERDLNKVCLDLELFEIYSKGFMESARDFLTAKEIELLPFGARMMTLECGIRFLTDHINGDVYFKIHRQGHNLDRARTQFRMVEDMEAKHAEMCRIIESIDKRGND